MPDPADPDVAQGAAYPGDLTQLAVIAILGAGTLWLLGVAAGHAVLPMGAPPGWTALGLTVLVGGVLQRLLVQGWTRYQGDMDAFVAPHFPPGRFLFSHSPHAGMSDIGDASPPSPSWQAFGWTTTSRGATVQLAMEGSVWTLFLHAPCGQHAWLWTATEVPQTIATFRSPHATLDTLEASWTFMTSEGHAKVREMVADLQAHSPAVFVRPGVIGVLLRDVEAYQADALRDRLGALIETLHDLATHITPTSSAPPSNRFYETWFEQIEDSYRVSGRRWLTFTWWLLLLTLYLSFLLALAD